MLDWLQWLERDWLVGEFNPIACRDQAALQNNCHDPGLSDQCSVRGPAKYSRKKPGPERFYLCTRISQAGYLDEGMIAKAKPGSDAQAKQVDSPGCDVLAHLAGRDQVPKLLQFGQEFVL